SARVGRLRHERPPPPAPPGGSGAWDRLHIGLLRLPRQADELDPDRAIVGAAMARAFGGGALTGPSPVGRRKKGPRHTRMVDRQGVPLATRTAPANAGGRRQIISPRYPTSRR